MSAKSKSTSKDQSSATIGFEAKLWLAADSRSAAETAEGNRSNNMDAAEPSGARQTAAGSPQGERGGANQYKHVVLGLIFLKYISDTAGKSQMSKSEVRSRNHQLIRHSKFIIRHSPPPTVGVSNAEVRMANRSRYTSTFEIRQSKFA